MILRSDGLELRGEDSLLPAPKAKPRDNTRCHLRFHIGPDIELAATDDPRTVLLRLANGSAWLFAAGIGKVEIDDSLWVDEDGRPHPGQQIVVEVIADRGGLSAGWQLRFLG